MFRINFSSQKSIVLLFNRNNDFLLRNSFFQRADRGTPFDCAQDKLLVPKSIVLLFYRNNDFLFRNSFFKEPIEGLEPTTC